MFTDILDLLEETKNIKVWGLNISRPRNMFLIISIEKRTEKLF